MAIADVGTCTLQGGRAPGPAPAGPDASQPTAARPSVSDAVMTSRAGSLVDPDAQSVVPVTGHVHVEALDQEALPRVEVGRLESQVAQCVDVHVLSSPSRRVVVGRDPLRSSGDRRPVTVGSPTVPPGTARRPIPVPESGIDGVDRSTAVPPPQLPDTSRSPGSGRSP